MRVLTKSFGESSKKALVAVENQYNQSLIRSVNPKYADCCEIQLPAVT